MLKDRTLLSEDELRTALDHCASEPIHIPGSIQPHGMLVTINNDGIIQQISANAHAFLGENAADCLNRPITDFMMASTLQQLQQNQHDQGLQPVRSMQLTLRNTLYDAVAHRSGDLTIIEFEPVTEDGRYSNLHYDQLRDFSIGMHKVRDRTAIYDHVTQSIRTMTGFDRVKLYIFDENWNGEVAAEARADFMPSYKGLHFPASDIPEQARRLYMQNYLRLIANTD